MAETFGGGRGGRAENRFPQIKGTAQVDPKKGPVKGPGKHREPPPKPKKA
jgi:hypothetical protein